MIYPVLGETEASNDHIPGRIGQKFRSIQNCSLTRAFAQSIFEALKGVTYG